MTPFSIIHYMAHSPRGAPLPDWSQGGVWWSHSGVTDPVSAVVAILDWLVINTHPAAQTEAKQSAFIDDFLYNMMMKTKSHTWDPLCYVLFHRGAMWWRTRTWERSASQTRVTERRSCMRPVPYPRWQITQYWLAAWHWWSTFTVGAMFDILINS